MDRDRGEVALAQELVKLGGAKSALDEDNDLVELELVEKLVELPVLLPLLERDEVLLETVERQLGIFVDVMLRGVLHEFPANGLDLVRQCGREHHHLLLLRGGAEDFLDIATHICAR